MNAAPLPNMDASSKRPRPDDRAANAVRAPVLRTGVNDAAQGSSFVQFGSTKILASVYGPRELPRTAGTEFSSNGVLECDLRYAPFAMRPRVDRTAAHVDRERQFSATLERALRPAVLLERFPKSLVEVHVLVLEADGSEVSAAIVAASLALVDAGVPMTDVPAAATVIGVPEASPAVPAAAASVSAAAAPATSAAPTLLVDPTAAEAAGATCAAVVTLLPQCGTVAQSTYTGKLPLPLYLESTKLAMDACATIHAAMVQALVQQEGKKLRALARKAAAAASAAAGADAAPTAAGTA